MYISPFGTCVGDLRIGGCTTRDITPRDVTVASPPRRADVTPFRYKSEDCALEQPPSRAL